jgi:hypothetical protein
MGFFFQILGSHSFQQLNACLKAWFGNEDVYKARADHYKNNLL